MDDIKTLPRTGRLPFSYYILDEDKNIVRIEDIEVALEWSMYKSNRRVRMDQVGEYIVSTVFLVFDHGFVGDGPVLFETMVFKDSQSVDTLGWTDRYTTYDDARAGHQAICDSVAAVL